MSGGSPPRPCRAEPSPTSALKVERILTDNGKNYTSQVFVHTAASHRIQIKQTRPYRPQINGKAEAFNKILQGKWAYLRLYTSKQERLSCSCPSSSTES